VVFKCVSEVEVEVEEVMRAAAERWNPKEENRGGTLQSSKKHITDMMSQKELICIPQNAGIPKRRIAVVAVYRGSVSNKSYSRAL